ncbi:SRPBCC family protein [Crossiella sp. SN42]|uniref:SRPBCC family protein n=1 Tax=Crossiella sp. SN42 TaxID=2944808 RepID=UPI00207D709D|nr:SRPBCC family protein [Crossiella sp. SN42]MCO1579248.1 SRPBCC family protein [Crossiella sp. SN42]
MTPLPTGRLFGTDTGADLVLTRSFRAPAEDVWASLTESERTARWFGPWKGEAGPGKTVQVQMVFEEGQAWMDLCIEECVPPRLLKVNTVDEAGVWRLTVEVSEVDGVSELKLVHHRDTLEGAGEIGPGWEYYLDMLVAAREDKPLPSFDDYYPAQKEYFEKLSIED